MVEPGAMTLSLFFHLANLQTDRIEQTIIFMAQLGK